MGYAAAIAFLLLIGLLFQASFLVYSAYALFGAFWINRYLAHRWIQAIAARRNPMKTEVEIGEEVVVAIEVANKSRWWIPWMLIEDVIPPRATKLPPVALSLQGTPLRLMTLNSKSTRIVSYSVKTNRRGYFQIGPTIAETGDLLGLHRQYRVLTPPEFLLVLPKIVPLAGYDISSRRPVGEIQVTYRLMEDPTLISGIREYQQGDPMKRVHWQATARTGKMHSKVYQPTCVAGAMLVLDFHRASNPDQHEPVRCDLAAAAAASVGHTLYLMQQQFGLVSNGRDAADRVRREGWASDHRSRAAAFQSVQMNANDDRLRPLVVPAGRGPEHFQEFHRTLARLERTDGLQLPALLAETQSRLPRDASVVVILQSIDDTAALALGMLRRQGYAVSAILNHYEGEAFRESAGRLLAQRIPVYHLRDEQSIQDICRSMLLRY